MKNITKLRSEARELIKKTNGKCVTLRSCWNCNPAHDYFKKGRWGKWILCCFGCGHYFYKKEDITEHVDK